MDKKLRVGVIGVGYVSKNNYLPVLAQREDIEFVGIMARNYENAVCAGRSFGAAHAVATMEELVALDLDCVFVLTPKQVHFEQVSFRTVPLCIRKTKYLQEFYQDHKNASIFQVHLLKIRFEHEFLVFYQQDYLCFPKTILHIYLSCSF